MIIQAPYEAPLTTSVFPEPELNDSLAPRHRVAFRTMMDGTVRTIVSRTDRVRLGMSLVLHPAKAEEFREFCRAYKAETWRLTLADGRQFKVALMTNPVNFEASGRDKLEATVEFQGFQVV